MAKTTPNIPTHRVLYYIGDEAKGVKKGTRIERHIVDADELILSGEWSYHNPSAAPEAAVGAPETATVAGTASHISTVAEQARKFAERIINTPAAGALVLLDDIKADDPTAATVLNLALTMEAGGKQRRSVINKIDEKRTAVARHLAVQATTMLGAAPPQQSTPQQPATPPAPDGAGATT